MDCALLAFIEFSGERSLETSNQGQKAPYRSPVLTLHGTIGALTKTNPNGTGVQDNANNEANYIT